MQFCSRIKITQKTFLWIIKEQIITWHYVSVYYEINKKEHMQKVKALKEIYLWDPFPEIVLLGEPLYPQAVLPVQNEEYWAETENTEML